MRKLLHSNFFFQFECRRCSRQPKLLRVKTYPRGSGCDPESGLRACRASDAVAPFEKRIKICQDRMEKVCDAPCFGCPTFCRPDKQLWCEDVYKVRNISEATITQ